MKPALTYRRAVARDIPALIDIRIEFMKEMQSDRLRQEKLLRRELARYFAAHFKNSDFAAWFCLHGGEIAGAGAISYYQLPPMRSNPSGRCGYILNMYTRKRYRRSGIAAALFRKLLAEGRKRKVGKFILHASDTGRLLYEKFGFELTKNEMALRV